MMKDVGAPVPMYDIAFVQILEALEQLVKKTFDCIRFRR